MPSSQNEIEVSNLPPTPAPITGTVTANQGTSPWASNIRVVPTDANSMYADCIYTDNDKVFSVSTHINQVTGGANNPLLLLQNPAGSGKRMYVRILSYGIPTANVLGIVNLYANPTITANGGAISPVNRNIGSGTASVILASTLPTISANGSLLRTATFGQNSTSIIENLEGRISVPANNSLLITGNPVSSNRVAGLTIVWIEL